jgi:CBS domain-containing protein
MKKRVADVMTRNPYKAYADMRLDEVIMLLAEHSISGLPVVDKQDRVIGMISETDLLWQESGVLPPPHILILDSVIYLNNPVTRDRQLHKALGQTVADVMTPHAITITADHSVAEAARVFNDRRIHRLPVIDTVTHKLVGIVTQGDVIQSMAQELLMVHGDRVTVAV